MDAPPNVPWFERRNIEARALVPVKAFQEELGKERANRVARRALDGLARDLGRAAGALVSGTPAEKMAALLPLFSGGGALDVDILKQTEDAFEFNVTGCRYAEFFKERGLSELGFLFLCEGDFAATEGVSPDLEMTRSQTIMQGATHCDFRYRLKTRGDAKA